MSLRVHLKRHAKHLEVDPAAVKRYARAVLRSQDVGEGVLCLVLTDNVRIRELNARYRSKDRATDVLAFPGDVDADPFLPPPPGARVEPRYLGDVVVSVERAVEQAPRFHNDPESELARLVTHGILHLLGHDHHTPAEGRRMKAAERAALRAFVPGTLVVRSTA